MTMIDNARVRDFTIFSVESGSFLSFFGPANPTGVIAENPTINCDDLVKSQ